MIKKSFVIFILFLIVLQSAAYAQKPVDYEKWGRIAVDVVKLNYPDASVSDYEYLGREQVTPEKTKDMFKLQVKSENTTFDVLVSVFHNPKTNSLITVEVQKVPQQK